MITDTSNDKTQKTAPEHVGSQDNTALNLYIPFYEFVKRDDISYVDRAAICEALERLAKYHGDDAGALEWCMIKGVQWQVAAANKEPVTLGQDTLDMLEHWAESSDDYMSKAIASEVLAEYYTSDAGKNSPEPKDPAIYRERAIVSWHAHYKSLDPVEITRT